MAIVFEVLSVILIIIGVIIAIVPNMWNEKDIYDYAISFGFVAAGLTGVILL